MIFDRATGLTSTEVGTIMEGGQDVRRIQTELIGRRSAK